MLRGAIAIAIVIRAALNRAVDALDVLGCTSAFLGIVHVPNLPFYRGGYPPPFQKAEMMKDMRPHPFSAVCRHSYFTQNKTKLFR